jgi:hypothetical protein
VVFPLFGVGILGTEPTIRATRILTESIYQWSGKETSTITQQLFAGDRSRVESLDPGAQAFEIERRDLRQRFRVFASRREYQALPLFDLATTQEKADFRFSGRHWRSRVIRETGEQNRELKITFSYQATGEERSMFGCTARQWTVRRRDEHDRKFRENWTEAITNAWYLDSAQLSSRFAGFSGAFVHHAFCVAKSGDEREVISHSGERPSGVCALSETRSLQHIELPDGNVQELTQSTSMRVVSIGEVSAPLSFFDPPSGFRKIPVYPSWWTMTRLGLKRSLNHFFRLSA